MARIWRICFTVRGSVRTRTMMVNRIMAMPIWLKLITYSTSSVLSMGRIMNWVHTQSMASNGPYPTTKSLAKISRTVSPETLWL